MKSLIDLIKETQQKQAEIEARLDALERIETGVDTLVESESVTDVLLGVETDVETE